jgi:hypothetical protein
MRELLIQPNLWVVRFAKKNEKILEILIPILRKLAQF